MHDTEAPGAHPPKDHPLSRLAVRLGELLDEDQWTECESLVLKAWEVGEKERTALADENEQLRLAEEGAKEAFGHVVQQKRDLEAECKRLRRLLDGAYETIRRQAVTPNARSEARPVGTSRSTEELGQQLKGR